jgi:hypothetical protein
VNHTITYTESRLLPAMIAGCLLLTAVCVSLSAEQFSMRLIVVGALVLAACWPMYRSLRPRWVLHIEKNKLRFNDLYARKVVEVDLATVVSARLDKTVVSGVGSEGGIGFQKKLVLETPTQALQLPLPFLAGKAERALAAVRNALSSANGNRR